ncbi:MAG: hypothetical protein IKX97_05455 [Erysipelotrichaceae bacterium]|nr:hypothetical protein [Erysipelotrichaceae bacterium]
MAKLTRTQKYAGLRETLANDSEPSLSTKELSNYEDRLNNIANQLNPSEKPIIEETTPIEQLVQSFKEEEELKNVKPAEPVMDRAMEEFNAILKEDIRPTENVQQNVPFKKDEDNSPYSKVETSPVGPMEIREPARPEKQVAEFENEKPEYMGLYVSPEQRKTTFSSLEDQIRTGIVDQSTLSTPVIDPVRPASQQPAAKPPVIERPEPTIMQEPADNHVIDHSNDVKNTFINDVMNEVDEHIKQTGQQTVSQLTSEMVNEVRRTEGPVQTGNVQPRPAAPVQETVQPRPAVQAQPGVTDDEFSNTVSMEIEKIMDEVIGGDSQQPAPSQIRRPQPVYEEPKTEPHPVLTKALEEEEVVEIKNINDTQMNDAPPREATTGTIPFVVAANDDFIDEDEEDEGSNTILNIILIILILILVAVLGLIVFYILKTKGII